MSKTDRTRVLVDGYRYLESPRWHNGELWCSDLLSRHVLSLNTRGRVTVRGYLPGQPSGIGFLGDGSVLMVSVHSRELVRLTEGRIQPVAATAVVWSGPLNDMVVDPTGRAWVSPMTDPSSGATTPLLFFDGTTVKRTETALAGPNGLALTDDGHTLIVAETNARRLTAFRITSDGEPVEGRVFADLGEWAPDGICVDAEGAVWVGCVFAGLFARVAEGGDVLGTVEVPGRWAVAPALGGPDGKTLYCATARTSLDRFRRGMSTAAIEMCQVEVPAVGTRTTTE